MKTEENAKGLVAEFRQFIARGNVMDLAVGVIIGGAFKTISDSLVGDILMPFIGIFIGKESFANLSFSLGGAVIQFGSFIQAIVNFLVIALVVFFLIKGMNGLHRKKPVAAEAAEAAELAPPPPSETELLMEIRDLLREKK